MFIVTFLKKTGKLSLRTRLLVRLMGGGAGRVRHRLGRALGTPQRARAGVRRRAGPGGRGPQGPRHERTRRPDRLGEGFEVRLAEGLVLDQLDVPVSVLLAGRLVHHHLDAGVLRPLQHRFEGLAVVRDDADDVNLLGDEILDGAHLFRRVIGSRVDHAGVDPEVLTRLENAFLDVVEPGNLHLADHPNLRRVIGGQHPDRG